MFPEKGSGLLWYNLFRNADPDLLTQHNACAVMLGNKWIGNKWIGYNAQWSSSMSCGLVEDDIFTL